MTKRPSGLRRLPPYLACLMLLAIAAQQSALAEASWELGGTTIKPATVEQARAVLTTRDEFVAALSPFDRAVRLQTDQPVSEAQFLRHLAGHALPWQETELARLKRVVESTHKKLAGWNLPWPEEILLVKMTGEVDGGAAYTRGNAIMLPQQRLAATDAQLERLLLHELFHVLSRHNPQLRPKLYAIVGFEPCGPIELPEALRARKITNPDAPGLDTCIELALSGETVHAVPLLYSQRPFDPSVGGTLFDHLTFRLLVVEKQGDAYVPKLKDGQPVLLNPYLTPAYLEQIGQNTTYILHPEEVLADNFVLLVQKAADPPTPRVLRELEAVLR